MKVHGIIYAVVKQDFAVIVAFYYNIWLFKNSVITILKVVGCGDCVGKNKLPLRGPGGEDPSLWAILVNFFRKKAAILTPFG